MWMFLLILALPAVALGQAITTLQPYNLTATLMFMDIDTNHNGNIDRIEVDESFSKYDADHNGRVSRTEWLRYVDAHSPTLHDVHDALFNIYDVDNDHILEKHDYDNLYALMDSETSNGIVSHFEFVRFWTILLPDLEKYLNGRGQTI